MTSRIVIEGMVIRALFQIWRVALGLPALAARRVTSGVLLRVTGDRDTGLSDLLVRRLAQEIVGFNAECVGQLGHGADAGQSSALDTRDCGEVHASLVGELLLQEHPSDAPVANARESNQRSTRGHRVATDRSDLGAFASWTRRMRADYAFCMASNRRLLCVFSIMVLLHGSVLPAWAENRTPPEATQHALDELANCRAQRRPECPTETATPTLLPSATPTPIPTATPTDVPTNSPEPTVTPLPILPAPAPGDDPALGYTRPIGNGWLELALPQGRWAVYQADDCAPQAEAWRQAWLTSAENGEVDLNAPGVVCGLVAAVWQSDAPCALDDQGVCQLVLDASYWDMLGHTPTAVPTDTPIPRLQAVPATRATRAAAPAPPAQVQVVVRTVVITATPADTPTPSPLSTQTPRPSVSPTRTATTSATPTFTPTVVALAIATPPASSADSLGRVRALVNDSNRLWLFGVVLGALAVGATWFWLTRGRRKYVL
jgi:hypothetical protein